MNIHVPSTCTYSMTSETSHLYWNLMEVKTGNVLDVACGQGGFAISKPKLVNLYGVDRDTNVLKKCIGYEDLKEIDLSAEKLSQKFKEIKFDGVLARDILEHLEKPWDLLGEIYQQMNIGGRIICSVPKADPKIVWSDYTHIRGFTRNAIESMINDSGFIVEKTFLMSGFTVAGKLGLTKYLPLICSFPFLGRFATSWHVIAIKK